MIDAYYSRGCDSSSLFDDTRIAESDDYRKYMNQYNVIHLDISSVWDFHKEDLVESIHQRVCEDIQKEYQDTLNYDKDLYLIIQEVYERTKIPFVIIIDEWDCVIRNSKDCDELLDETIDGNADRVAELVELAHETYTSVLTYNDENSLSCVLTMAYFTAQGYYNIIREMPSGKGFADFTFIPRSNAGWRPAMVVELKYNRTADTAIRQIKEKRYQGALSGYSDKILLVGINYDAEGKDKKHHTCVIEEWQG